MKKQRVISIITILTTLMCLVLPMTFDIVSYAQSSRASDEQLIARAINGEARGSLMKVRWQLEL